MTPADLVKVKPLQWVGNKAAHYDGVGYYFVIKNIRTGMIESSISWGDGFSGYDMTWDDEGDEYWLPYSAIPDPNNTQQGEPK